jgi:lycopene beta-cyclase
MSLLIHMLDSGQFTRKRILAVDLSVKSMNDRTWCFWEKEAGVFESVVSKTWKHLWFHGSAFSKLLHIHPYQYKMIRGIDFYTYCLSRIQAAPNIEIRYGSVSEMQTEPADAYIVLENKKYSADYIFSSIHSKQERQPEDHHLIQHFLGWVVEMEKDRFNPEQATLMDFQTTQEYGTSFIYLMPLTKRKALIEFTIFSERLIESDQYESSLKAYMKNHFGSDSFTISEKEVGAIPMTSQAFPEQEGRITYIGSAGGRTKPSSGYTFYFIQRQSEYIVKDLLEYGHPLPFKTNRKFRFYDRVLLNVLATDKMKGEKLFTRFFQSNRISDALAFLNNESGYRQDLGIISSLPWKPFLKAGWEERKTRQPVK